MKFKKISLVYFLDLSNAMVAAKLVFCYKLAISMLSWSPSFQKLRENERKLYWENVRIWGAISHLRLT